MHNVDNTIETQSIISMCPGIGGLERGLARTSLPIRTICYVEIEAFIVANMVAQMEVGLLDQAPIWTNVKTFDGNPFRGMVHGITAGYPCQPFSHAGERKGADDPRHLWPYILEQIKVIRPQWVFFENVGGHLSMGYEEVRRSLSSAGYRVEEGIFTAEETGAPHRRERLFILGVMENAGILGWGGGSVGDTRGNGCEIQTPGSSPTLDNSDFECEHGCTSTCGRRESQYSISSGNVEHPNDSDVKHLPGKGNEEQRIFGNTGSQLADTSSPRNTSGIPDARQWKERTSRKLNNGGDEHRFPTGQGIYQHPWEEPRTIESGMEYTIDGYNFTEDLHRAIGNSVVEQTAEIAFRDLVKKHIKTASYGKY